MGMGSKAIGVAVVIGALNHSIKEGRDDIQNLTTRESEIKVDLYLQQTEYSELIKKIGFECLHGKGEDAIIKEVKDINKILKKIYVFDINDEKQYGLKHAGECEWYKDIIFTDNNGEEKGYIHSQKLNMSSDLTPDPISLISNIPSFFYKKMMNEYNLQYKINKS